MRCTIQQDRMGSLHIWKGWNRKIEQTAKYMYKAVRSTDDEIDGECTVYLQGDDTQYLINTLPQDKAADVQNGWKINVDIDDCYWPEK